MLHGLKTNIAEQSKPATARMKFGNENILWVVLKPFRRYDKLSVGEVDILARVYGPFQSLLLLIVLKIPTVAIFEVQGLIFDRNARVCDG